MRRRLLLGLSIPVLLLGLLLMASYATFARQGLSDAELSERSGARVERDAVGVPTIRAPSWLEAVEVEGQVVASERLFQMDLLRRAASGRLAEWFGSAAVEADRRRRLEDWAGVAERAFEALPAEERSYVEAYARGVNRFIQEARWRWGLEYLALRVEPEPWEGRDTMLVLLMMIEQLTSTADDDAVRARWFEHVGEPWGDFLFPTDHPWNEPMFGAKRRAGPALPADRLPLRAIDAEDARPEHGALDVSEAEVPGSNSWGWCGRSGCLLANDPHLGASVPQTWYAVRLRVSPSEWVAGVSLPGIPGVVLGMNAHLAWAFTNVGEDVDDLLAEVLSEDGRQYLASRGANGEEVWRPLVTRSHTIHVRDGADVEVVSRHTHRGPLVSTPTHPEVLFARQWLAYAPGALRIPIRFAFARDVAELDRALDDFRAPAQNVVSIDRRGTLAYRASGTGILRRPGLGRGPYPALEGEWLGFAPPETRPRAVFSVLKQAESGTVSSSTARFVATANERIWVDEVAHEWDEDLRKERIRRALASAEELRREDMERLQEDTESRYHRLLLAWVAARADRASPALEARLARWSAWNGRATDDPATFADALAVDAELVRSCLLRVRRARLPDGLRDLPYPTSMKSAWVIAMLETEGGTEVFGLEARDLARHLAAFAEAQAGKRTVAYAEENRWRAQHPFVGRVPVLGALFHVEERPQVGSGRVVRVERPTFGASVRLVWNIERPEESTWSFPVGQSGHPSSPHFQSFRARWFQGERTRVFEPNFFDEGQ